jgi:glycosyltransferase 2 family protein
MIVKFIKVFLVLALVYFILENKIIDFTLFKKINFFLTLQVFIVIILVVFLGSLKWYILLKIQNFNINFKNTFKAYYFGYSLNYILFGLAGDVFKTLLIIKDNNNKIGIAMSVIVDRLIGFLSMIFIIILFLPYILFNMGYFEGISMLLIKNINIYYMSVFLFVSVFLLFLKKVLNSRRLNIKFIKFLKKFKSAPLILARRTVKAFFTYRKSFDTLCINLFLAFITQILITLCLFIISLNIFSDNLGFINQLISSVIVQLLSVIPISPGNIGISEIAFSEIMYHLNNKIIYKYASIYLIFRFFNMLISIPSVVLYFIYYKEK